MRELMTLVVMSMGGALGAALGILSLVLGVAADGAFHVAAGLLAIGRGLMRLSGRVLLWGSSRPRVAPSVPATGVAAATPADGPGAALAAPREPDGGVCSLMWRGPLGGVWVEMPLVFTSAAERDRLYAAFVLSDRQFRPRARRVLM